MRSCYGKLVKNWENVQGIASTIQTRRLELCSISEFVKSQIMFVLFPTPRAVILSLTSIQIRKKFQSTLFKEIRSEITILCEHVKKIRPASWTCRLSESLFTKSEKDCVGDYTLLARNKMFCQIRRWSHSPYILIIISF